MDKIEIIEPNYVKCDADGCNYTEDIPTSNKMTDYINKPCPKCGANLLTYEDYLRYEAAINAVSLINEMSEDELKELSAIVDASGQAEEIKNMMKEFTQDDLVKVSVSTHKQIKIESVEKID